MGIGHLYIFIKKKFNNAYNISINKIFKRANFIRKNNN